MRGSSHIIYNYGCEQLTALIEWFATEFWLQLLSKEKK